MEALTKKQQQALIDYQNHVKSMDQNENKSILAQKNATKVLFQTEEGVLFLNRLNLSEIPVKGELVIWMRICFEVELVIRDYDNNCVCVNLIKL